MKTLLDVTKSVIENLWCDLQRVISKRFSVLVKKVLRERT
jgi:hypothetical protein